MDERCFCLREGETVRWRGRTGTVRLLEQHARLQIFGKWLGTAVAAVVLPGLYITAVPAWKAGVVGVIVLLALLLMIEPVQEWDSLRRQRYFLTDQRAVIITGEREVYAMELEEVDEFRITTLNGGDCLILGSCIFERAAGQLRWYGCHPQAERRRGQQGCRIVGMVFYGVKNAADAAEYLRRRENVGAA